VLALAAGALVFSACGASPPPAAELAEEMIDTLVLQEGLSQAVADCMKEEVEGFELTEQEAQGFNDLDDVAQKASDGQAQALQIMERFEDALAACNTAG
jgi:hypothetical protein